MMLLSKVVFPAPLRPTKLAIVELGISRDKSLKIATD